MKTEDELRIEREQARREWSAMSGAFDNIRAAMVARLFATPISNTNEREGLYFKVNVLDEVKRDILSVASIGTQEAIDQYLEEITNPKPATTDE